MKKIIYLTKKYGFKLYQYLHLIYSNLNDYTFDIKNYENTFLTYNSKIDFTPKKVDKIVYCFWTGNNPLTENRIKALETMKKNMGVEIKLVTPENLNQYIVENYPLHSGFKNLSTNHKSDYLRCYFMHHHGGGYADIKIFLYDWNKAFDKINQNDNCYKIGYREIGRQCVGKVEGKIGRDLKNHFPKLVGNGSFICKPKTPYTYEWITELHKRMDKYEAQLEKYPGNIFGTNKGYPVPWGNLMSEICHPLQLKYLTHIMIDNSLFFDIENSGR